MDDRLAAVLGQSRSLGFLGPGDVRAHERHAKAFVGAWAEHRASTPRAMLDLGSGGGVPGLVLASHWAPTRTVLLDASERRGSFLQEAVDLLGISSTTTVAVGRAEALARTVDLEGSFDLVTARSFGPPATTAECAARFLAPGGLLIVSEPPDAQTRLDRWPAEGLAALGLGPAALHAGDRHLVAIDRVSTCPARFPRRDGVPGKRPLF